MYTAQFDEESCDGAIDEAGECVVLEDEASTNPAFDASEEKAVKSFEAESVKVPVCCPFDDEEFVSI